MHDPRNSTRFAAQYPARGLPCERFKLSLAASPCITRGRGGWLGLTPWKTCTSYPLPACLAHSLKGQSRRLGTRDSPRQCRLSSVCVGISGIAANDVMGQLRSWPRTGTRRIIPYSACPGRQIACKSPQRRNARSPGGRSHVQNTDVPRRAIDELSCFLGSRWIPDFRSPVAATA